MDTETFLRHAFKVHITIEPKIPHPILPYNYLRIAKHLTGYMDFGCTRCTFKSDNLGKEDRRCCPTCFHSVGHIRRIPADVDILKLYAEAFSEPNGFWTPNGCTLPRQLRSEVCVTYHCYGKAHLSIEDQFVLALIRHGYTEKVEMEYIDVLDQKYILTYHQNIYDSGTDEYTKKDIKTILYLKLLKDQFLKNDSEEYLHELENRI